MIIGKSELERDINRALAFVGNIVRDCEFGSDSLDAEELALLSLIFDAKVSLKKAKLQLDKMVAVQNGQLVKR